MAWYANEENKRRNAQGMMELEQRVANGEIYESLKAPARGHLCLSGWGKAWCRCVEEFAAWQGRTSPGRSLLRKGRVFNVKICGNEVFAEVVDDQIYRVKFAIKPLDDEAKEQIRQKLAGATLGVLELSRGGASDELLFDLAQSGLFPQVGEIRATCECDDWADVCRHSAAVFYGLGLVWEKDPNLLFKLRGCLPEELLEETLNSLEDESLENSQIGQIFGIDLED